MLLRAIERGLTISEFEEMTFGMVMDYVITFNNEHLSDEEKEDSTVSMATQADFDRY